jgi:aminoglycoside 3'-phosphotransferase-2
MKVKLSERLEREYGNVDWQRVSIGESSAQVYQNDKFVLKTQLKTNRETLFNEKSKMEWLKEKVPVPDIVDYEVDATHEYLLMNRIIGIDAAQTKWKSDPQILVNQLGHALRELHDKIDITNCPFDMRLACKLKEATERLKIRTVSEASRVDDHLLAELNGTTPDEDLVFTHGDYCLPNIIIDEEQCCVVGFVDLGHAGIADRYHDLALCLRSIQYNIGEGYSQIFLNAYGLFINWDENKIAFYQQLEDFL